MKLLFDALRVRSCTLHWEWVLCWLNGRKPSFKGNSFRGSNFLALHSWLLHLLLEMLLRGLHRHSFRLPRWYLFNVISLLNRWGKVSCQINIFPPHKCFCPLGRPKYASHKIVVIWVYLFMLFDQRPLLWTSQYSAVFDITPVWPHELRVTHNTNLRWNKNTLYTTGTRKQEKCFFQWGAEKKLRREQGNVSEVEIDIGTCW